MTQIDYFYSLASPFTYLAGDRLEQIAARHGAEVIYRPCDMAGIFGQTGGLPPAKRHPFRQEYRLQELKRLSAHAGLPLNLAPRYWPVNPVPASLSVLAVARAGGDPGSISRAYLRACWAEERDIADEATMAEILGGEGHAPEVILPAAAAEQSTFDANTALAMQKGVFGAPFYVVGDERFWGQDRLEYLDRHLATL